MKPFSFPSFNLPSFLVGCVVIALSCFIFYSFGDRKPKLLTDIDYRFMDLMFHFRGPQPDSGQVVIIDIDEKSLTGLGQWPWPRNLMADLTATLISHHAKAIGFDIVFAEKDRSSPSFYFKNLPPDLAAQIPSGLLSQFLNDEHLDYDSQFAQTLSSGPTILGYVFRTVDDNLNTSDSLPFPSGTTAIHPSTFTFKNLNLKQAYQAIVNHPSVAMAESEGFFNVFADDTGITRQVPLFMRMKNIPYPSLALETYRIGTRDEAMTLHLSEKLKMPRPPILGVRINDTFIPTDAMAQLFINFRGPTGSFPYIPAIDIINGSRAHDVKNKFVLIGSSAKGLQDLRTTPFSNAIPGVEINANIIDNLIRKDPFVYDHFTEIGITYAMILGGGIMISSILSLLGPLAGSIGAAGMIFGSIMMNYHYFFLQQRYVGMIYPLLTAILILLATSIFNAFREQKTKRYIRKAFSHYVAKDVVAEMIKNPKSLSLKGEEKELTVLFSDIRGFTGISEVMPSQALGYFMNDYLSRMSQIIIENNGTVDKFIGDAVMAFWGAPKDDAWHAYKAVKAAMEMKAEVSRMALEFKQRNLPDINIGIGINTGKMSVGNFGSKERFDYTVMGDNVNLASRLEGANKNYGTVILISQSTRQQIAEHVFCQYIDKVQVKGRLQAIDLYEPLVVGQPDKLLSENVSLFEQGVKAYQNRDFKRASHIMTTLYQKQPLRLYESYIERINAFKASPPPPEWSGVERRARLPVHKLKTK
jgi:adenylate cyclase